MCLATASKLGQRMVTLMSSLFNFRAISLDISTAFLQGLSFDALREKGLLRRPRSDRGHLENGATIFEQDLPFLHRIDMVTKWQAMPTYYSILKDKEMVTASDEAMDEKIRAPGGVQFLVESFF